MALIQVSELLQFTQMDQRVQQEDLSHIPKIHEIRVGLLRIGLPKSTD